MDPTDKDRQPAGVGAEPIVPLTSSFERIGEPDTEIPDAARYVSDPFDNPRMGKRVGVHRVAPRRGAGLIHFLWAAIAAVVLAVAGIVFIVIGPSNISLPSTSQSNQPTVATQIPDVTARIDAKTTVAVLNGTGNDAIATDVATFISSKGLGVIGFEGPSKETNIPQSAVFYSSPSDEDLAKGLAEELGGLQYYENSDNALDTQLVVRLGTEFVLPTK